MKKFKDLRSSRKAADGSELRSVNVFVNEEVFEYLRTNASKNYRSVSSEVRHCIDVAMEAEKHGKT